MTQARRGERGEACQHTNQQHNNTRRRNGDTHAKQEGEASKPGIKTLQLHTYYVPHLRLGHTTRENKARSKQRRHAYDSTHPGCMQTTKPKLLAVAHQLSRHNALQLHTDSPVPMLMWLCALSGMYSFHSSTPA